MSERTPPLGTIRHAWAKAHPFPLTTEVEERYAEFDRWLAAHVAEKRAEWEAEQGEPEWEYGVTTKWGMHGHPHLEGAERYASELRAEIEQGRSSGDLAYHGLIKMRTKAVPGPWLPVPDTTNTESEKP